METVAMDHALARYRAAHGISPTAFARSIGASKSMVWKWENRKAVPRPVYVEKIVKATGGVVTHSDLLLPAGVAA